MKIVTVSLYMSNGLLNTDEIIFRLNCYLYNVFDQSYFFVYTAEVMNLMFAVLAVPHSY
jgi:hypothetical protein